MLKSLRRQNERLLAENEFYQNRLEISLELNESLLNMIERVKDENKKLLEQVERLEEWNRNAERDNLELIAKIAELSGHKV